nr:UvrD-helicase domain-containing protein [Neorhizobium tomejilense]
MSQLADSEARHIALTRLDRSFLVEAGAGSGKTSLLAGRVVGLMVNGVKPANIVSVSFTELAASELLGRIFDFSMGLLSGKVPMDIRQAYPDGLTPGQTENLRMAVETIGDMTCTTIHGFCQKLLRPYPVEAAIDPGASILDPGEADLIFNEVLDKWMRKRMSGHDMDENIVTAMVGHDPAQAVDAIQAIAHRLKANPDLVTAPAVLTRDSMRSFFDAVEAFRAWTALRPSSPEDHNALVESWRRVVAEVDKVASDRPHIAIVKLCALQLDPGVCLKSGGYRGYRMKTAWKALDKANAEFLNDEGLRHYQACCDAFDRLRETAAAAGLYELEANVRPVLTDYYQYKRDSALLDFDDLLYRTRTLLSDYPAILQSMKEYYTHILVDEFQDTDPVQAAIFRMLAFELRDGIERPRPGAIFFVGDPKQSIYRFRGADVASYVLMRELMREADPSSVMSIFVNFRSTEGIIGYVNGVFEKPLADVRQPGFTHLASHRGAMPTAAVMKYEATIDAGVDERRKLEADRIADAVFNLMSTYRIALKDGTDRACAAGDIALLAPVNTNLFWLENALEDRGIPVSTQAGKGLFQQQEVKDLIALTRVLADPRDTLALGALLRGSFFGFTDAELLDISHSLPATEEGHIPFLTLATDPADIADQPMSGVIAALAGLRRAAIHSTPFDILSKAIDVFDVRAKTRNREFSNASRRLANIERFLDLCRSYDVRGLRAFSDSMRQKWENSERVQEGRPGGLENSVSIITIHSSKGLEWPVVFTVNCATEFNNRQTMFSDVRNSTFAMKFLKQKPTGFDEYVAECRAEDHAERVRLMYVGLTRARDLLVVPDIAFKSVPKAWSDLVDTRIETLEYIEAPTNAAPIRTIMENGETVNREQHLAIIASIEKNRNVVQKRVPSNHEFHAGFSGGLAFDDILEAVPDMNPYANIEGGVERGNILHKLMEEIINGETDPADVPVRALDLIRQITTAKNGKLPDLHAEEIAACIERTLRLPQIVAILPRLVAEVGTSASAKEGNVETLTLGVADAMVAGKGCVEIVVDWKGDLRPSGLAISNYKKQVGNYMKITGAALGLIVFMSTGQVVEVMA